MKKLRRKRMLLQGVSAVCNMGGTWMMVVTVCQIVQSAERTTVGGFVLGMLAALAYGLCALLLWSYGLDLADAAAADHAEDRKNAGKGNVCGNKKHEAGRGTADQLEEMRVMRRDG